MDPNPPTVCFGPVWPFPLSSFFSASPYREALPIQVKQWAEQSSSLVTAQVLAPGPLGPSSSPHTPRPRSPNLAHQRPPKKIFAWIRADLNGSARIGTLPGEPEFSGSEERVGCPPKAWMQDPTFGTHGPLPHLGAISPGPHNTLALHFLTL